MDRVSIIMPCYNDGIFISESINSVLNQTYKNIELIIINDGSTEEYTNKILSENKWEKTIIIHSCNLGPSAARNLAIEKCTGEYILPLDADDLISPTYIEKAVNIMKKNKKIGIVYCKADLFGERTGIWDLPDYSLKKMLVNNIVFVTAIFRKDDWKKVGGFNTNMKYGMEDYDFWISILEIEKEIYQIPEVLFHYRIKQESRTTEFENDIQKMVYTYNLIYDNHKVFYDKYKTLYAKSLREELIYKMYENKKFYLLKIPKTRFLKNIYRILKLLKRKIMSIYS